MSEQKELNPISMRCALESIYMVARMKRVITHRYPEGKPPEQIGPQSDDTDWDKVIQHCERAGLRPKVVRAMASK